MGAWGNRSFDNDDAADWLGDLVEGEDLELVRATFARVLEAPDYVEAPEASQAIAAAEVVAAALGRPTPAAQEEEDLIGWLVRVKPSADATLAEQAAQVLDRILADNSELRELWEESDEFGVWQTEIVGLRSRLQV